LATGAEIEAEGSEEFVTSQRDVFISATAPPVALEAPRQGPADLSAPLAWEPLIEIKGNGIQLRAKLSDGDKGPHEACLMLLAAAQKLLHLAKPTAAQLARWLRASGYPVRRVDRAISEAISKGEILASGSRRSRRYELSGPGRLRALILGRQLAALIGA
jgi:hypothetical protein